MDFRDTPAQAAFRADVRAFLRKAAPTHYELDMEEFSLSPELRQWFAALASKGWLAPAWPREYGGGGLSIEHQFIFNEEMALQKAPRPTHLLPGINMVGPTLIAHGTPEQRRDHLGATLSGEHIWCQGFSETNAGSDLAALQTRAERAGDDYVITGQKLWTSFAHYANWMFLLARTDPQAPKHKGISYFILPMDSPGITVRPLLNMAGTHEFNEVFLDRVRVPATDLVGRENEGWYVGMSTLEFERSGIGAAIGRMQTVNDLVTLYKGLPEGSGRMPRWSARPLLADLAIGVRVSQLMAYQVASLQAARKPITYQASVTKLFSTDLNQRIHRAGVALLNLYGQLTTGSKYAPASGRLPYKFLRSLANTIEGGTSEIQRGVIATRGLGLPRS